MSIAPNYVGLLVMMIFIPWTLFLILFIKYLYRFGKKMKQKRQFHKSLKLSDKFDKIVFQKEKRSFDRSWKLSKKYSKKYQKIYIRLRQSKTERQNGL